MKYILMCGGNYTRFTKPKQLLTVCGEVLVERTIRLLKENGVNDIVISTNCKDFDYLGLPILMQNNKYVSYGENENKKAECCWLNAYSLMEEPCCYIHGDVYFSENAIKTIVNTKAKDTMFFCVRDIQDGRPTGINAKGREPLAYKVENQNIFKNAINELLKMVDDGVYNNMIAPFSWHLYRYINGLNYISNDLGYINNIFETKGDYVVIDDYSTDVDDIEDIPKIEMTIRKVKGVEKMIKVRVTSQFHLGKFNELIDIVRKNPNKNENGTLYTDDTFICTEEMLNYLQGANAIGRSFVEVVEIIPEKKKEDVIVENKVEEVEAIVEKPKRKKTTSKKTIAKKD